MTEATADESCKVGGVWQQLDMESLRSENQRLKWQLKSAVNEKNIALNAHKQLIENVLTQLSSINILGANLKAFLSNQKPALLDQYNQQDTEQHDEQNYIFGDRCKEIKPTETPAETMSLMIDSVSGTATVPNLPTSASAHITISQNATSTFQEEASTNRERSTEEAGRYVHEKPCSKKRKRNNENFKEKSRTEKNSPLSLKDGKMKAMYSIKESHASSEKKAKGPERISQNKSSKTIKENAREDEIASPKKAKENVGTGESPEIEIVDVEQGGELFKNDLRSSLVDDISDSDDDDEVYQIINEYKNRSTVAEEATLLEGIPLSERRRRKSNTFFGNATAVEEMNKSLSCQPFIKMKDADRKDSAKGKDPLRKLPPQAAGKPSPSNRQLKIPTLEIFNTDFDPARLDADDSWHRKLGGLQLVDFIRCNQCAEYFDSSDSFNEHSSKDHKIKCWEETCHHRFLSKIDMVKHTRIEHDASDSSKLLKQCAICEVFIDVKSVHNHKHAGRNNSCPPCSLYFSSKKDLLQHHVITHKIKQRK